MRKRTWAIALCRVSSPEQKLSNSLNRQEQNVISEATKLETEVIKWWSGDISSKAGTNVKRKDLKEMEEFCKRNKRVKYLIVDEPDRFMRSIDEAFYFEVLFREIGVKVWYASDQSLNTEDLQAKLLKFSKYPPAEGSNVERITKSINGQTAALKDGRWPFCPKPGYKRGYQSGIPEVHEIRGPALKAVLVRLANRLVTPAQALVELNGSAFTIDRALYKMDKFRKIVTDPFYAGIVEIDRQVKVRNENGLHEPLITREQHNELLKIMNDKKKNQSGPRKNGNPKYPLNNMVNCSKCGNERIGRVVGFDHGNGKPNSKIWEKYRCRACGRYLTRQDLHLRVEKRFKDNPITPGGIEDFIEALDIVWRQREGQAAQEANRIGHKIKDLMQTIEQKVDAATDPSNASIKEEILSSIEKKKVEVTDLEEQLKQLSSKAAQDKDQFLRFAYKFADEMGRRFLEISPENRLRCKDLIFPAGFYLDASDKVYTPEISPLITLLPTEKDAEASQKAHLVRVKRL